MTFATAVNTSALYLTHPDSYSREAYEFAIRPLNDDELKTLRLAVPILRDIVEQARELAKLDQEQNLASIGEKCSYTGIGSAAGLITLELTQHLISSNLLEKILKVASPALSAVSIISQVGAVATLVIAPAFLESIMNNRNREAKFVGADMMSAISDKQNRRSILQQQETINNLIRYISLRDGVGANQLTGGHEDDNQIGIDGANLAMPQHSTQ